MKKKGGGGEKEKERKKKEEEEEEEKKKERQKDLPWSLLFSIYIIGRLDPNSLTKRSWQR